MERRAENNCPTAHKAPPAPYYAVIFSSTLSDNAEGYGAMAARMVELAREHGACASAAAGPEVMGAFAGFRNFRSFLLIPINKAHATTAKERPTAMGTIKVASAYGVVRRASKQAIMASSMNYHQLRAQ
jgi:hypothetical protein